MNASAFVHGDQATLSDIFEHDEEGAKTGVVFRSAPGRYPKTLLFTALNSVLSIMDSFAIISTDTENVMGCRLKARTIYNRPSI